MTTRKPATERDTTPVTDRDQSSPATQRESDESVVEAATQRHTSDGTPPDLGRRGGGGTRPGPGRGSGSRPQPLAAGFRASAGSATEREPASDLGKQGADPATERDSASVATLGDRLRLAGPQRYDPAVDLSTLRDHPRNPRRGDDAAVAGSIDATGWYGAIIAQTSTRRILAGHTRRRSLTAEGATHAPVLWVDVDDDTAEDILIADNRLAELATWDADQLAEVLTPWSPERLAAVGFTADDLLIMAAGNTGYDTGRDHDGDGDEPDPHGLWPLLAFRVPPLVLSRFRALPGADDAERLEALVIDP